MFEKKLYYRLVHTVLLLFAKSQFQSILVGLYFRLKH